MTTPKLYISAAHVHLSPSSSSGAAQAKVPATPSRRETYVPASTRASPTSATLASPPGVSRMLWDWVGGCENGWRGSEGAKSGRQGKGRRNALVQRMPRTTPHFPHPPPPACLSSFPHSLALTSR